MPEPDSPLPVTNPRSRIKKIAPGPSGNARGVRHLYPRADGAG